MTETVRDAIRLVPKSTWTTVLDVDGQAREHADVVETAGLLSLSTWPAGVPGHRPP